MLYQLFWLFLAFSFLGWCLEVAATAVRLGQYRDRGVLHGPLCLVYGITGCLITIALRELSGGWFFLFLFSALYATVVEWIAGHLLEHYSHTRWWDYSDRKWNLDGYICLSASVVWGALGLVTVKWLVPLLMLPVLMMVLPESAMYMVVRRVSREKIAAVLRRAGGHFAPNTTFVLNTPVIRKRAAVLQLFSKGYAGGTLVLWITYFMGLFVIYLLNGWLPTIMRTSGFSLERAAMIAGLFQLGGPLGGLLVGYLMDRFAAKYVIGLFYLLGMACLLAQGFGAFGPAVLAVLVFFSGFCINGAQNGLQGFSPAFYPTEMRATGVSWMHGIGRTGAILSSSIGGVLLVTFPGTTSIFIILPIPALLAAITITRHQKATPPEQVKGIDINDLPALSRTMNNR